MSNIRVFVQWKDTTVFAGEPIECTITFKNVSSITNTLASPLDSQKANGLRGDERSRRIASPSTSQGHGVSRNTSFASQRSPEIQRSAPLPSPGIANSLVESYNGPSHYGVLRSESMNNIRKSGRSLSIISLGLDSTTDGARERPSTAISKRPSRAHGRSASLQILPTRGSGSTQGSSPFLSPTPPVLESHAFQFPPKSSNRHTGNTPTPNAHTGAHIARKQSGSFRSFKFPASPDRGSIIETPSDTEFSADIKTLISHNKTYTARGQEAQNLSQETLSPRARVLAGTSMGGTPRSSGEFYAGSNNSTETLASEYVPQSSARLLPSSLETNRAAYQRQSLSQSSSISEVLMMGYAQLMGSFTLDGSLVNQAPFEEVKRKGVVGGQAGGGVVGVERTKRDSSLFGALGWSTLSESLGGIINPSEPSSIREMRGLASSKAIPLLSTPQSILFVDLRLSPGESKSFKYSFTMPRGLPPSHKGRAIKVSYHIVIGTQRPNSATGQQVTRVTVPFRVFGSVTSTGDVLGHDLMSPYIILRDQAQVSSIEQTIKEKRDKAKPNDVASRDFLSYTDKLLENAHITGDNMGLMSPTDHGNMRQSYFEEPQSMKDTIDFAILRSNMVASSNASANRFEIARGGRRVAVIVLARPAYRLGESIPIIIDFDHSEIPCYSIHMSLETSEKVDPAIALRSNASIHRVTRKIHAAFSENVLFAQRLTFFPTVPPTSTPEFITSGVSLEWRVRVEFITPRIPARSGNNRRYCNLLEEISNDDRGTTLAALENVSCESFEVAIPVKVYGAVTGGHGSSEDEGLAV